MIVFSRHIRMIALLALLPALAPSAGHAGEDVSPNDELPVTDEIELTAFQAERMRSRDVDFGIDEADGDNGPAARQAGRYIDIGAPPSINAPPVINLEAGQNAAAPSSTTQLYQRGAGNSAVQRR